MTPGLGEAEYSSRQNSQSLNQIISRGLNAPYNLVQHTLLNVISDDLWAVRLASVFFALLIFTFLFLLLRSWFGSTIAIFAGLIFITTPWVVNIARTGTPNITYLWMIVPLASFIMMERSKTKAGTWWVILCATAALGIYIPGFFWLLLIGALATGRPILKTTSRINSLFLIAGMALGALLVIPLFLSLAFEPSRIKQLLLMPTTLDPTIEILKSAAWAVSSLFWVARSGVDIGIGRLPVLNILQIVLTVFGVYALSTRARNITYVLLGVLFFSILASGINNNSYYLIFGLPAIAVLIGAGLRYLYIEWRRIFPLNPFAYALAIGLISLVTGTHILYGARYSLIAWPHTAETKNTYVLK